MSLVSQYTSCNAAQDAFSGPDSGAIAPCVSVAATLEKSIDFICGAAQLSMMQRVAKQQWLSMHALRRCVTSTTRGPEQSTHTVRGPCCHFLRKTPSDMVPCRWQAARRLAVSIAVTPP